MSRCHIKLDDTHRLPFLENWLRASPCQETDGHEDEDEDHKLVLCTISLETCCEDISFGGIAADWQVVFQAELLAAILT